MRLSCAILLIALSACGPTQPPPSPPDRRPAPTQSVASAASVGEPTRTIPKRDLAPEQPVAASGSTTPWHEAAKAGNVAELKALLERDPTGMHGADERGLAPIHHACGVSLEAARQLLDAGARVRARSANGTTPLYVSARMDKPRIAALLIERGAAIDEVGPDKNTPLVQAVWRARLGLVDLLLKHGADPNARDADGSTALHAAAKTNKSDVVVRLLEAKADLNAADGAGNTPLHATAQLLDADEAAKALLAAGARRDVQNAAGQTPHVLAVAKGRKKLAATLAE